MRTQLFIEFPPASILKFGRNDYDHQILNKNRFCHSDKDGPQDMDLTF